MDQKRHDIAVKLLRSILDKMGLTYKLTTKSYGRRDGYLEDVVVIYVDSSKYHMHGPNYEIDYQNTMEFIEDILYSKLSKFGLDDDVRLQIEFVKTNYEWVKEMINWYITTILEPGETNPESYYDLVTDLERHPFLTITTDVKKLRKWLEPKYYDMYIGTNEN
jgi:hypothetical protein